MRQLDDTSGQTQDLQAHGGPAWYVVLRTLREAAGLTQEQWAARVGYGRRTIQRWECGESPPDSDAAEALIRTCSELRLFGPHRTGVLAEQTLTADGLRLVLSDARLEPSSALDARLLGARAHTLPVDLETFVGRDDELTQIVQLLKTARLVTLTGPGGVGKTRLALEAASELLEWYSDRVSPVDLAPVANATLVAATIARAVGVRESASSSLRDSLVLFLRPWRFLLVLDNFEHLLQAAPLVSDLLIACPQLTVLATSREPLRLRHEHQFPVAPLDVPPAGDTRLGAIRNSAAVQLFAQRAAQALPEFRLTPENARTVADICLRLDGLPLAIELAAPRLKVLSVELLLDRLQHRLPLLVEGARDLPDRQRTLRATIAWSYDLLHPREQRLLRELARFPGGCALDAAEAVCRLDQHGDWSILQGLTSLVDKSLLQPVVNHGDRPRFTMLDTIREFTLEQPVEAGEQHRFGACYVKYFLAMVEQAETALEFGSGQVTALERLEREHNNLRTAIQLAAECETVDLELRLVGSLAYFWIMRGYFTEALERLRNALQRGRSAPAGHRAKALAYAGYLAFQQGDSAAAERLLEEAETLANSAGDHSLQALVLVNRAFIARAQGRKSEDLQLIEAAIRSGESANIPPPSILRYQHANALLRLGDINRASMLHEENLRDARAVGDAYSAAAVLLDLGFIALARGNQKRAAACWREALGLVEQLGELLIGEFCLEALALISGLQGRLEQAAVLLGAAERMCQRIGAPAPGAPGTEHRVSLPGAPSIAEIIDNARRALGEPAFTTAWRMGSDASIQYLIDQTCEL